MKILNKRLNHSLKKIQKYPKAFIIVAGGSKLENNMEESYYMSEWLAPHVPNIPIFTETCSIDTVTNLIYVKQLIFSKKLSNNIIFVTSPAHKNRVSCLARYLFKSFKVSCYDNVTRNIHNDDQAIARDKRRMELFLINRPYYRNVKI
jgi:hypothetical protein